MVYRLDPAGPVHAYKTYSIGQPLSTHWRRATCAEVDCPRYVNGWTTELYPADSTQHQIAANWIRSQRRTLRFTEELCEDGLVVFSFESGQECFKGRDGQHRAPLGRLPLLINRDGDYRGNPTGRKLVHTRAEDWRDDLGEHLGHLADIRKRG